MLSLSFKLPLVLFSLVLFPFLSALLLYVSIYKTLLYSIQSVFWGAFRVVDVQFYFAVHCVLRTGYTVIALHESDVWVSDNEICFYRHNYALLAAKAGNELVLT